MRFPWRSSRVSGPPRPVHQREPIAVTDLPGISSALRSTTSRRSDRILTPISIRVSGVDADGSPFQEDSITVSVNKHGACISLQHVLGPEQEITIQNLENGIATQFRVVGELRQVFGGRREWGVETHCPECNIWGLEFGQPPEDAQPKVLIACAECKSGLLAPLTSIQFDVLVYTGVISRHCNHCGQTTRWAPSGNSPEPQLIARAMRSAGNPLERRTHRRRSLTMLVQVRNNRGDVELVQTLDVSKGGLSFVSKRPYDVGELLFLVLPCAEKAKPAETRGVIVRRELTERGTVYGLRFEKL